MGSCVSVDKEKKSEAEAEIEAKLGVNVNENGLINGGEPGFRPSGFNGERGSKDETFFDSQPWLDSDCENDYFSVNGDLTPSFGTTPVHESLIKPSTLQLTFDNSSTESSPSDGNKKRLSELFSESFGGYEFYNDAFESVTSNEATPKESKSTQCCIPNIIWTRNFEVQRKKMSPARLSG